MNGQMKIGIRSASVNAGEKFGEIEILTLKQHGFELVELNFNRIPLSDNLSDSTCWELRRLRMVHHIDWSAHAPDEINLSSASNKSNEHGIAAVVKTIRAASLAGAEVLVVHDFTPAYPEADKKLLQSLRKLIPFCERYKVKLALETLIPGYNASNLEFLTKVLNELDSPLLGICIDTNHLNLSFSLVEGVKLAGTRLFECHINDNHGKKEEHLVPFDGTIDWKSFIKSLQQIKFQGNLIMEPSRRHEETFEELLCKASHASSKLSQLVQD